MRENVVSARALRSVRTMTLGPSQFRLTRSAMSRGAHRTGECCVMGIGACILGRWMCEYARVACEHTLGFNFH